MKKCHGCHFRLLCEHRRNEAWWRELAGEPKGYTVAEEPEKPVLNVPGVKYKQPPKAAEHD